MNKQELEGILTLLKMKKEFLESCAKDYEAQIKACEKMIQDAEPTVKVEEKPTESKAN